MEERGLTSADVEAVLLHPDSNEPGNKPRRRVIHGRSRGRRVRVIVVEGLHPPLVVTAIDLGRAR